MDEQATSKPSALRRFVAFLRRPSAKYSLIGLLSVGFVSGILFWGGFNTAMDATNTMEFCIGCHEMKDTVYQEYKETIHFQNRSGVRATCSDCHVPKDWAHKLVRKVKASHEVWGALMGTIDTPEKFEKHRMRLAQSQWEQMKASGSRECRNCHNFDQMDPKKQKPSAQKKHAKAKAEGKTCIDCHKGIAHLLPAEYEPPEDEE